MSAVEKLKQHAPKLVTLTLVVVAGIAAFALYQRYKERPWTRDGQVRADVVEIVPRVSGYLVKVNVEDNAFVHEGQLLFQIDPEPYQLAVTKAEVALDQAREEVASLEAAVKAAEASVKQQTAKVTSAQSKIDEAQASVESAEAAVREADSGVTSATAFIAQVTAQLEEAERQAARAKRLADKQAGPVEDAEAKAAGVLSYKAQLASAKAGLVQSKATLDKAKAAESQARARLVTSQNGLVEAQAGELTAKANLDQAESNLGEPGEANVRIRDAKVKLEQEQLNLRWTSIKAPSDGYITNMKLLNSTFVTPGTPFALFVDSSSFRVEGYFQETKLKNLKPGDTAIVTLMGDEERRLEGTVESIGYAINPPNLASTDGPENLVPTIQPTFEWIRLAQRVPVRIRLTNVPDDLHLVSGMTASISIEK